MSMNMDQLTPEMLMHIPVTPPPEGVTSNFIDPPSRAKQTQVTIGIMLSLIVPALLLRIYTRVKKLKIFGADDWMAIASAVCVISYSGLLLWSKYCLRAIHLAFPTFRSVLDYPLGRHEWDVPIGRLTKGYVKVQPPHLHVGPH